MNEPTALEFKPEDQIIGHVNTGAASYRMLEIGMYVTKEGKPATLDATYCGDIHAIWGDRCLNVKASAFWPWAASLAGIEVVGAYSTVRTLMDFDQTEAYDADEKHGLHVYVMSPEYTIVREKSLSVGEFWGALEVLAT